jgi:hypothetical protein
VKNILFHVAFIALGVLVLAVALSLHEILPKVAAQKQDASGSIFPPGSKPYGKSFGEWSANWWQWAVASPSDKNPMTDTSGKICQEGQGGPAWFLAGTMGGAANRVCSVPSDKAIVFPVQTAECSSAEYPQYKTEPDLLRCAKDQIDKVSSLDVVIDGKKVPDLRKYRAQSPLFGLTLPNNNVFGKSAGPTKAVSDGYWLILSPLSPGSHDIRFSGTMVDFTSAAPINYATAVTYHLNVGK